MTVAAGMQKQVSCLLQVEDDTRGVAESNELPREPSGEAGIQQERLRQGAPSQQQSASQAQAASGIMHDTQQVRAKIGRPVDQIKPGIGIGFC